MLIAVVGTLPPVIPLSGKSGHRAPGVRAEFFCPCTTCTSLPVRAFYIRQGICLKACTHIQVVRRRVARIIKEGRTHA